MPEATIDRDNPGHRKLAARVDVLELIGQELAALSGGMGTNLAKSDHEARMVSLRNLR